MLFRDAINPVFIVYRFTAPFPILLPYPTGHDLHVLLADDGYGGAELRVQHVGPHSSALRKWGSVEEAVFCCANGIEFDYNPGPNYLRDLARAGLAAVVIGPFCRLRYSDPTATDRGYWPVPDWTGPRGLLYEGERSKPSLNAIQAPLNGRPGEDQTYPKQP